MLVIAEDRIREVKMTLQVLPWSRSVERTNLNKFLESLALKWEGEAHILLNWPNTPDRDFQIAQLRRCARELRIAVRSRKLIGGT